MHRKNFSTEMTIHRNASGMVDFHVFNQGDAAQFAYEPELLDEQLAEVGRVDLFLAGPPCQGHSNLNNKTRRDDPRNILYLTAVALAVALQACAIVIENVPDVINDRSDVISTAIALLRHAGYGHIDKAVLAADGLGAAQTRKRFFIIAVRDPSPVSPPTLKATSEALRRPPAPLSWAIGDLLDDESHGIMNTVPASSEENQRRIDYLFDNEAYDLPDHERPDCHKDGHTYKSVYGRLWWDKPSYTITTGFLTPGRGRFIHPLRRRVITPHEAARIQFFPDTFSFVVNPENEPNRTQLSKWIGDAVPPILGYAAVLPALVGLLPTSEHASNG